MGQLFDIIEEKINNLRNSECQKVFNKWAKEYKFSYRDIGFVLVDSNDINLLLDNNNLWNAIWTDVLNEQITIQPQLMSYGGSNTFEQNLYDISCISTSDIVFNNISKVVEIRDWTKVIPLTDFLYKDIYWEYSQGIFTTFDDFFEAYFILCNYMVKEDRTQYKNLVKSHILSK
jgi:hypothetical protein